MTEELITFLTTQLPLVSSLLTAVVGLIVVALKYKKQKYEIAILEEANKLEASKKDALTIDEVEAIRSIIREVKK